MNLPLLLILVLAGLLRCFYLFDPFVRIEEWGMAQFSVYAANYHRFGYLDAGFFPLFGKVGEMNFPYANHPPLASVILGLWTQVVGNSEAAARVLSILFQLGSIVTVHEIGKRFFDKRVALWAAGVFAFLPQSLYMGHFYTMEVPMTLFTLLGIYFVAVWAQTDSGRDFSLAVLFLVLGNACDYYPYFLSPAFGIWAIVEFRKKAPPARIALWLTLTFLGPVCFGAQMLYLHMFGWAKTLMVSGASKYSTPWAVWANPGYYQTLARRLLFETGIVPTITTVMGLRLLRSWNRGQTVLMSLLICLPVTDVIVCSDAVYRHHYRTLNFFPLIAVASALILARVSWSRLIPLGLVFVAVGSFSLKSYYTVLRPDTAKIGATVRNATSDKDILVGLPPDLAYYIDRPASVPYFYLWKHSSLYESPEQLFRELHPLAQLEGYERIILFTRFLVRSDGPRFDWSKTFDSVPNLQRVSEVGQDPQIWEFVEESEGAKPAPE